MFLFQVWLLKPLWLLFPRRNSLAQCSVCPSCEQHILWVTAMTIPRWQHTEELVTECYKPVGWAVIWPWILTQNLGHMQVNCLHPLSGSSLGSPVPNWIFVLLWKTKLMTVKKPGNVLPLQGKKKNWILTLSFVYWDKECYHIIIQGNYLHSKHLQLTTDMFYHILWYIFNVLVDFYIPFHLCLFP